MRLTALITLVAILALSSGPASSREATVAVAANFLGAMEPLQKAFELQDGGRLKLSAGSTAHLYTTIRNGAPFDVFLSADEKHPQLLEAAGRGVTGTRFTYAIGVLVLWSADADRIGEDGPAVLRRSDYRRLAIANPDLAPYGAAARDVLEGLGLWQHVQVKLVMGLNVLQAYQWVATGNAELGFVALAQFSAPGAQSSGSRWVVPAVQHRVVRQDAILLSRARANETARSFLSFLRSETARTTIQDLGYKLP